VFLIQNKDEALSVWRSHSPRPTGIQYGGWLRGVTGRALQPRRPL